MRMQIAALRHAAWLALALAAAPSDAASDPLAYAPLPGASARPRPAVEIDPQELGPFIDKLMQAQLAKGHVPGAAVAIVKGGKVLLSGGYGQANLAAKVAVDAEETRFRVGSVSKLLTWTAVMQLLDAGKLKLDDDINVHLDPDSRVGTEFESPVTVRNLLTHTGGFEVNTLGYMGATGPGASIGATVAAHRPNRVSVPTSDFGHGEGVAYSNWAAALAGHLVEVVSGEPFDAYVERHILEPLKMDRSTFREPVPGPQAALAIGYRYGNFSFTPMPFEYYHGVAPAGGFTTTAADMARFMIAHLQEGRYDDRRILQEPTARLMHSRALSPGPHVNGATLGFFETYVNGRRLIEHPGKTVFFQAELALVPEAQLGLFIVYNAVPPPQVPAAFVNAFMDHYFPADLPTVTPPADFAARGTALAGAYSLSGHSHTTLEKLLLPLRAFDVTLTDHGTLVTSNLSGQGPSEWVEVDQATHTFRNAERDETIAFMEGPAGRRYIVGPVAFAPAYRLHGLEKPKINAVLIGIFVLVFLTAIIAALPRTVGNAHAPWRWLAAATGLNNLAVLVLLTLAILHIQNHLELALIKLPGSFRAALWLALLSIPATMVMLAGMVLAWRRGYWSRYGRVEYTLLTLAAVVFLAWLQFWNLIGFHEA
jgi:CubicO group peptidase (beta-lactamase class C family)